MKFQPDNLIRYTPVKINNELRSMPLCQGCQSILKIAQLEPAKYHRCGCVPLCSTCNRTEDQYTIGCPECLGDEHEADFEDDEGFVAPAVSVMPSRELTVAEKLETDLCPWCGNFCHYVETDPQTEKVRVGVICDQSIDADNGSAMGNDWGRGEWQDTAVAAIEDWNIRKRNGEWPDAP